MSDSEKRQSCDARQTNDDYDYFPMGMHLGFLAVKEHAPLSAGARVDHGVEVETTEEHVNRAADRGGCVSTSAYL